MIKQPGGGGELSFKEGFYEKVEADVKKGGLVFIKQAQDPKTSRLTRIELDMEGIPQREVPFMWRAFKKD